MSVLLEILDIKDDIAQKLKANELDGQTHAKQLMQTKLSPAALQNAYQTTQVQLANDLAAAVQGANAPVQVQDVPQSIAGQPTPPTRPALFTAVRRSLDLSCKRRFHCPLRWRGFNISDNRCIDGLCSGRIFQPVPGQYFVAHYCDPDSFADWRDCIVDAVARASSSSTPLEPYFAGDSILGGFRLCGICEKLYAADFSLFLLPPEEDPNVYLELGIAIGLGRPFFLIQKRNAVIPSI
jgi:hypothetical protein